MIMTSEKCSRLASNSVVVTRDSVASKCLGMPQIGRLELDGFPSVPAVWGGGISRAKEIMCEAAAAATPKKTNTVSVTLFASPLAPHNGFYKSQN